jgi:hypothetical protein
MAGFGKITIGIVNYEGMRALVQAAELAAEIAEDQPWNDDAKELVECLQVAAESMGVVKRS